MDNLPHNLNKKKKKIKRQKLSSTQMTIYIYLIYVSSMF